MAKIFHLLYGVLIKMNPRSTGESVPGARNDNEEPHIHLFFGKSIIKLYLKSWIYKVVQGREQQEILSAIEDIKPYQEELIDMWNTQKFHIIQVPSKKKRSDKNIISIDKKN